MSNTINRTEINNLFAYNRESGSFLSGISLKIARQILSEIPDKIKQDTAWLTSRSISENASSKIYMSQLSEKCDKSWYPWENAQDSPQVTRYPSKHNYLAVFDNIASISTQTAHCDRFMMGLIIVCRTAFRLVHVKIIFDAQRNV